MNDSFQDSAEEALLPSSDLTLSLDSPDNKVARVENGPPSEPRKSVYDAVVLHKLIVNVSWAEACKACNLDVKLRASAQQRYQAQKAWFDYVVANHFNQEVARLGVNQQNVLETCALAINDTLLYIRRRQFPANPDLEFWKTEKEMASTLERYMAVASVFKGADSPFVKDVGGGGNEIY